MEPLNNKLWHSAWRWAFWGLGNATPKTQARDSVYWHLRSRFDWPFIDEGK